MCWDCQKEMLYMVFRKLGAHHESQSLQLMVCNFSNHHQNLFLNSHHMLNYW